MYSTTTIGRLSIILFACACVAQQRGEWNLLSSGPYKPREGSMAYALNNGTVLLLGGRNDATFYNDVWRSDDFGRTWNVVIKDGDAPWGKRGYHTVEMLGSCLFMTSGQSLFHFYNDVWRSCDLGRTWEELSKDGRSGSDIFSARAGAATIVARDRLWVAAGSYADFVFLGRKFFNDVWSTADGVTWIKEIGDAPWKARSGPRLVKTCSTNDTSGVEEVLIIAGERGFTAKEQLGDVWTTVNGSPSNWSLVSATNPWQPRSGHGVYTAPGNCGAGGNSRVVLVAGWPELHDVWRSDDAGSTWVQLSDLAWNCSSTKCGKFDFAFANTDQYIWTLGGSGASSTFGKMYDESWVLKGALE